MVPVDSLGKDIVTSQKHCKIKGLRAFRKSFLCCLFLFVNLMTSAISRDMVWLVVEKDARKTQNDYKQDALRRYFCGKKK